MWRRWFDFSEQHSNWFSNETGLRLHRPAFASGFAISSRNPPGGIQHSPGMLGCNSAVASRKLYDSLLLQQL